MRWEELVQDDSLAETLDALLHAGEPETQRVLVLKVKDRLEDVLDVCEHVLDPGTKLEPAERCSELVAPGGDGFCRDHG